MGSERRILGELEAKGITGPEAREGLEAIEVLNSTGDAFGDAIYSWTDLNEPEVALKEMRNALQQAQEAVGVLSNLIENSRA